MRVTFVRGAEAIFFSAIILLVAGIITIAVHNTNLKSPDKPASLAEWDEETAPKAPVLPQPEPAKLEELGFEALPGKDIPLPWSTRAFNDIHANLLNFLHYYYK